MLGGGRKKSLSLSCKDECVILRNGICVPEVGSCCNNSAEVIKKATGLLGFLLVGVQKTKKIGLQASDPSPGMEVKGHQRSPGALLCVTVGESLAAASLALTIKGT